LIQNSGSIVGSDFSLTYDSSHEWDAQTNLPFSARGTGDEIAQAVLLLVRDAFITGQTLAVNGGTLLC
jgi:NAD(P)-dependent dehydrogenase (short-subunit alcohol dehydrogenase family)